MFFFRIFTTTCDCQYIVLRIILTKILVEFWKRNECVIAGIKNCNAQKTCRRVICKG